MQQFELASYYQCRVFFCCIFFVNIHSIVSMVITFWFSFLHNFFFFLSIFFPYIFPLLFSLSQIRRILSVWWDVSKKYHIMLLLFTGIHLKVLPRYVYYYSIKRYKNLCYKYTPHLYEWSFLLLLLWMLDRKMLKIKWEKKKYFSIDLNLIRLSKISGRNVSNLINDYSLHAKHDTLYRSYRLDQHTISILIPF